MILLTVTVCLATAREMVCQTHVELVPTVAECREKGRLHVSYVRASDPDGQVVWSGWTCKGGRFG